MLAADKLLLQSNFKRNAVELKEKEFRLHHDNFSSVGTQASVLAGFAVAALVELDIPVGTSRILQFSYFFSVCVSLAANLQCVACTTCVTVWGSSLALRGPDGAVLKAVEQMYLERGRIFCLFAIGVIAIHFAAMCAAAMIMQFEAMLASNFAVAYSLFTLVQYCQRLSARMHYDERDTVNFDDLFTPNAGRVPDTDKDVEAS
ncbi:hypothetical protein CYMTET_56349 [Cymbomonas tetramitiformis]|uniref:Transmembrane protein n=1 Tax=Cymbomonas tetramitiformis TaxID=36881 RepID=A0AAE0BCV4_9CHLO|nr:hypothetical protein CYMTET_56349 [Cymbomonas tetramitiformis]